MQSGKRFGNDLFHGAGEYNRYSEDRCRRENHDAGGCVVVRDSEKAVGDQGFLYSIRPRVCLPRGRHLLVADTENNQRKINEEGQVSTVAG